MSDAPKKKFDPRAGLDKLIAQLTILKRYSFLIFIIFVAGLYGFLLFRINGLSSQQPTQDAINSQVKAAAIPLIRRSSSSYSRCKIIASTSKLSSTTLATTRSKNRLTGY